jgi:mono/diheme cytochrome c family protein
MKRPLIVVAAAFCLIAACADVPRWRDVSGLSGKEMYEQLCASCHGVNGEGDGPVAPLITIGVPDLTRLAARAGGEFPAEDVQRTIDGRFERRGHGPRDMPVWGWQFYDIVNPNRPEERARVDEMIGRLVDYLRSIQKG